VTFYYEVLKVKWQNSLMRNSPPTHLLKDAQAQKAKDLKWFNFVTEELSFEQLVAYCKEHGFETEGKTDQEMRLALLQSRY
jgi:hypothetical protein